MKSSKPLLFLVILSLNALAFAGSKEKNCPTYLNQEIKRLHSAKVVNLCDYYHEGKPILVVNTASNCGYTPQFKELESLYQKYKDSGFVILGFPSNSFNQEEKTEESTARVCYKNYGVSFPMFTHVSVKGEDSHPLFKYLATKSEEPGWNFNKYLLINDDVTHFPSSVKPLNSDIEKRLVF